ncbi:mitochondrial ribosomal protein s18 [Favolaschia claudopus]|uniref:Small ribosomal subunit protein bS18m n=1 Tax=Favolaschia claudopus TaxID=2862362 RepID=A0AAW0ECM7_9AGAR
MLACVRATRLRSTRPFAFSTCAVARNDNPMAPLTDILIDEADRTPPKNRPLDNPPPQTTTNRAVQEYRPVVPHSFIRPFDLSLEGRRYRDRQQSNPAQIPPSTRDARKADVFYQLGVDPLDFAQQPAVLSKFMSELAMIYPRRTTSLTTKSQRRIAKAIRRAKMMGVIPLHSRVRDSGRNW